MKGMWLRDERKAITSIRLFTAFRALFDVSLQFFSENTTTRCAVRESRRGGDPTECLVGA